MYTIVCDSGYNGYRCFGLFDTFQQAKQSLIECFEAIKNELSEYGNVKFEEQYDYDLFDDRFLIWNEGKSECIMDYQIAVIEQ